MASTSAFGRHPYCARRHPPTASATIPVILRFLQGHPREVAEPGALFLNYANADGNGRLGGARDMAASPTRIGLCHGVQRWPAEQIARVLKKVNDSRANRLCVLGHPTTRPGTSTTTRRQMAARWRRTSCSPRSNGTRVYSKQEKVRIDVLKRFGVYSTEEQRPSEREYLPWYRKRPDEIRALDRRRRLDQRRDRRLPRCSTRRRNWFETGLPEVPRRRRQSRSQRGSSAPASNASHPSKRWRPAAPLSRAFQRPQQTASYRNLPADAIIPGEETSTASAINVVERHHFPAPHCAAHLHRCRSRRATAQRRGRDDRQNIDTLKLAVLHDPPGRRDLHALDEVWQEWSTKMGRGAGAVVAAIRRRDPGRQGAPSHKSTDQDQGLGGRGAPGCPLGRRTARDEGLHHTSAKHAVGVLSADGVRGRRGTCAAWWRWRDWTRVRVAAPIIASTAPPSP